jgi:hypothetical protein
MVAHHGHAGAAAQCSYACNVLVVQELTGRQTPGYAIGGLVGGEEKTLFVRTVSQVSCIAGTQLSLRFPSVFMSRCPALGCAV